MNRVKLSLGYCPVRDLHWVAWTYNPDFLQRFKAEIHWPDRQWDAERKVWWITEPVLWREFEWLGKEFRYERIC